MSSRTLPRAALAASPAQRQRARWRRWLSPTRLVVAAVLLAAGALLAVRSARGTAVEVHVVQRGPLVERVVASGRVLAPAEVKLGSVLLGTVARVHVDEGQRVEPGAVLLELDAAEAEAALAQARAGVGSAAARLEQVRRVRLRVTSERLKSAAASLAQAESNQARQRSLYEEGAATKAELDEANKALEVARTEHAAALAEAESAGPGGSETRVAQAAVTEAQAAYELARARLGQTRIIAPASGTILERNVEPGDVVSPGQTLLVLARAGSTRLLVDVDEKNLSQLHVGQTGKASADAFGAQSFAVQIAFIAPAVDADRGTIEVRLEVPEPPAYLRPDMTVSVDIEVGRRQDVTVLPLAAIRESSSDAPWALVVDGTRAVRRDLELGARGGSVVEVISGVEPGDRVVLSDGGSLEPGTRVRVTATRPAALARAGG